MSVTDEIKTRLDIVNYIQQFVPLKRAGRTYKACCPFHNEKTPSFVVNPESQTWRCFGSCAEGGDIFSFAQKYHGWVFSEALQELGKLAGVEIQQQSAEQKQQAARLDALRGLMQAAADYFGEQLQYAGDVLRYVREKRGFTDETIQTYAIGYAPDGWHTTLDYLKQLGYPEDDIVEVGLARRNEQGRVYDYFRNRLMIAIRDERGRVIGFGARALAADDNPKYLNSPQTALFDKSRTLFGLDRARRAIHDTEMAVIVEGYMDVIQAHQAGFLNVVAQMGTAMTEYQLKMLAPRWAKKIILALDADAAGQNATMRSLEVARTTLRADYSGKLAVDIRVLQIPGAKDPDDLIRETPQEWPALVESAVPVADYIIQMETAALPLNATVQEREVVARRLLPLLLASENDLYRQDNIQKLALRLRIPENNLLALAAEQQYIAQARSPRRFRDEQPPDFPPLDYDDRDAPPDDEGALPAARPRQTAPASREVMRCEADCLGGLLRDPNLLFQINRKFRELAGSNNVGPLAAFGVEDFSHSDYRAVMQVITEAVEQDDLPPADYLYEYLDSNLITVLNEDRVLASTEEFVDLHLRHRFNGDRQAILRKLTKDEMSEAGRQVLRNALSLRLHRLKRESEELRLYLQNEAAGEVEHVSLEIHQHYAAAVKAIFLIDSELQQQARQVY